MATASAYTDVAQELYVSYFGRPADTNGLLSMTAALAAAGAPADTAGLDAAYRSNAAVRGLLDSFAGSAESGALYGTSAPGFDTVSFVSQIYNNLFGRTPDASGLAFWTRAIDSGSLSQAAAAHSILTGAIVANNADAALVNKKVVFANKFTAAMDTMAEVDAYRGDMAAQFGRDLLAQVTARSDPSTMQASVDATLARLGAAVILSAGADKPASGSGPMLFLADLDGRGASLQSGDSLAGSAALDTLRAVLGPMIPGQIPMPATASVEKVLINAAGGTEPSGQSALDARLMGGVTRWENDHSRGDLIIMNAGILGEQLPEDVTIAMVGTAAGNADFGVYFAPSALRASNPSAGSPTLRLQLMDTRASVAGDAPLKENPYDGFRFLFNKMPVLVRSAAIDQAQTYDQLLTAIKAQMATIPGLEKLAVTLGEPFQAYDTQSGVLQTGREILISNTGSGILGLAPGPGWVQPGAYADAAMVPGAYAGAAALITGTIVLDNVGRGGIGGDLVAGGTPLSDLNSVRSGFEAFNITVERSSKLQTINSTDNTLQVVNLASGSAAGDLTLRGATTGTAQDTPLKGTGSYPSPIAGAYGSQAGDAYGLHDVRQLNAGAMSGKLDLTAVISAAALNKYISAPGTRSGAPGESVDFHYIGGSNDDKVSLDIDPGMGGSRGVRLTGHEDFRFFVNGGGGDDLLQARFLRSPDGSKGWVIDQDLNNNLMLSGGAGNDTIRRTGEGDAIIDGGSGNDMIFGDASGSQGVWLPGMPRYEHADAKGQWVFNTRDQSDALAPARIIGQLDSDRADAYQLTGAKVDVSFRGIESKVIVGTSLLTPASSDKDVNEAIKHAINDDAILSKLLLATDGPGSTLVVNALIDGAVAAGELRIALHAADGVDRSGIDAFNARGDYRSALAVNQDGPTFPVNQNGQLMQAVTGGKSYMASDNLITPGTGDDLVVLGTAEGASKAASSNDTLVFGGEFGNDTIVNFDLNGMGIDHLDLSILGGVSLTASLTADKSIGIAPASALNDTAAKVAALFNADNAAPQSHVYAVADASGNAAAIYAVTDAAGAGNAVATLAGSIHLGQAAWLGGLTAANFVDASSAGYSSAEGASGLVSVQVGLVGVAPDGMLA